MTLRDLFMLLPRGWRAALIGLGAALVAVALFGAGYVLRSVQ